MSLEERIREWKQGLYRFRHLEEGTITELEDHLRSEIKAMMDDGSSEDEAFNKSTEKIGLPDDINQAEKEILSPGYGSWSMFRSLIFSFTRMSLRQFRKYKLTTSINLVGLTAAFTVALFIGLFIHDELSFERHHPDAEQIIPLGLHVYPG